MDGHKLRSISSTRSGPRAGAALGLGRFALGTMVVVTLSRLPA